MISEQDKKQIEERAEKLYPTKGIEHLIKSGRSMLIQSNHAYIAGATDQLLIDQAEILKWVNLNKSQASQISAKDVRQTILEHSIRKQAAEIAELKRLMPIGLITLNDQITQLTEQLRVATEALYNTDCEYYYHGTDEKHHKPEQCTKCVALEQIKKLGEK